MAMNSTSQIVPNLANSQASGQSVFWALAAVVLNAMLQPSFSGYLWGGASFKDALWPHRSSPTICILDAIAETWILLKKFKKTNPDQERNPTAHNGAADHHKTTAAKHTDVTLRLVIFVLAVLPQAVKLFSMRGIPVTQVLAALFFVSSLVSMMRAICIESPDKDVLKLVDGLKTAENGFKAKVAVGIFGWILHGIALIYIWYRIAEKAKLVPTENVAEPILFVSISVNTVILIYIMQHHAFMLLDIRPPIPRYPILIIFGYTNTFGLIPDLMLGPPGRCARGRNKWRFAGTLLCNVALCSYSIAYVLELFAKALLKWSRRTQLSIGASSELPMTTLNIFDLAESTRAIVNESEQTTGFENGEHSRTRMERSSTYTQADSVTTTTVTTPPEALNNQEPATDASADIAEQIILERVPPPTSNVGNSFSTVTTPAIQYLNSDSEDCNREGGDGGTIGISSEDTTDNISPNDTSATELAPAPTKDLTILEKLVVGIFAFFGILAILILWYGGVDILHLDEDPETARQGAAEQGTAGPQIVTEGYINPEATTHASLLWRLFIQINRPFRFIAKLVLKLMWRFILASSSQLGYTFYWLKRKVTSHTDTLMVAFGILNFMTAVIYYLTLFDKEGTFTPQWTSFLG